MAKEPPRPSVLLRETLPTVEHAATFFDMLAARLGERAIVRTGNEGKQRALYVRAGGGGTFVLPWPLLTLFIADRPEGELSEGDEEEEKIQTPAWSPGEPFDMLARGVHPTPASVILYDGDVHLTVNYRWNGRWREDGESAPLDAFASLVPALSRASDNRLELLAEYAESIDLGRHGPARVLLPRPTPGGPEAAWNVGCRAIREAMASRRTPGGSFWAVADGYAGIAIAFGASRDEALAKWRTEVERLRPAPPPPKSIEGAPDVPDDLSEAIRLLPPAWDAPPFDPSPEFVPAAAVRVAPLPAAKPARGAWSRWLGERGTTNFAVRLPLPNGSTLVGESLLPRIDLTTIDAALDAIDDERPESVTGSGLPGEFDRPPYTHSTVYYRCVDLRTGLAIDPRFDQSSIGTGFDAGGFDGGLLRSCIVRVRRIA